MRVVVTRPEHAAARTAARLVAMGHQPVLLPLSRPAHYPDVAAEALNQPYSALAVTSAEALRVLSRHELIEAVDRDIPLYAVGSATAGAAVDLGFRSVRSGIGGGSELADVIATQRSSPDELLLYLAGTPRAPAFEQRMAALGQTFRVAEVYEMIPVDYTAHQFAATITDPPADAVLLYSLENAQRFFALAGTDGTALLATKILCLSDRTAGAVPATFAGAVQVAATPEEDALLALL